MQFAIVTLSPKGQITIPQIIRRHLYAKKYLLERRGDLIVLKPVKLTVAKKNSFVSQVLVEAILSLSAEEKTLYDLIRKSPCKSDVLATKTQFELGKIDDLLMDLEDKGVVQRDRQFCWEAVPLS